MKTCTIPHFKCPILPNLEKRYPLLIERLGRDYIHVECSGHGQIVPKQLRGFRNRNIRLAISSSWD